MSAFVQVVMQAAPITHYVALAQTLLFRGAGLEVVWPQYLALAAIGTVLFVLVLVRSRRQRASCCTNFYNFT